MHARSSKLNNSVINAITIVNVVAAAPLKIRAADASSDQKFRNVNANKPTAILAAMTTNHITVSLSAKLNRYGRQMAIDALRAASK